MPQRTVVMIDGTDVGALRAQGWELEYPRVFSMVTQGAGHRPDGSRRDIVVANVYLQTPHNPGDGWQGFLDYLHRQGYAAVQCQGRHSTPLYVLHDLLVYTLNDKIDTAILIYGSAQGMNGCFAMALQTAKAHGVQVEIWALDSVPEAIKREAVFQNLKETPLLRAA